MNKHTAASITEEQEQEEWEEKWKKQAKKKKKNIQLLLIWASAVPITALYQMRLRRCRRDESSS